MALPAIFPAKDSMSGSDSPFIQLIKAAWSYKEPSDEFIPEVHYDNILYIYFIEYSRWCIVYTGVYCTGSVYYCVLFSSSSLIV